MLRRPPRRPCGRTSAHAAGGRRSTSLNCGGHRDLLWMFACGTSRSATSRRSSATPGRVVVPIVQVVVFTFIFGNVLGVSDKVSEEYGRGTAVRALRSHRADRLELLQGRHRRLGRTPAQQRGHYSQDLRAAAGPSDSGDGQAGRRRGRSSSCLMVALTIWFAADESYDVHMTPMIVLSPVLLLAGAAIPALAIGLFAASLTVNYRDLAARAAVRVQHPVLPDAGHSARASFCPTIGSGCCC